MSSRPSSDEKRVVVIQSAAPQAIEWAAEEIARGGVVALPTDTVYGIAASLAHPDAIERLYRIKGRRFDQPIPILLSSADQLHHLTGRRDTRVALLLDRFWPGPLTVVLPAASHLSGRVVAGDNTVGVRMPNHPRAIEIIAKAGGTVACTSANLSGGPEARSADEVAATIGSEVDLILDGGLTPGGHASTVVRFDVDGPVVLRKGPISETEIRSEWEKLSPES